MAMAAAISGKQPAGTTYDQTWIMLGVLEIKEDMKKFREKLISYEDKDLSHPSKNEEFLMKN